MFAQPMDGVSQINPDSSSVSIADSLSILSELSTSDSTKKKNSVDINSVIYSKATDSLRFDITNKKMFLYGDSELKYEKAILNSGEIEVDFTSNDINAKGIVDPKDSTGINIIQTPVLSEGGQTFEGSRLKYNFKTQSGFISMAKNKNSSTSYRGEKVKKVDKDTYFIENGIFTSCESDTPHTYFKSSQMKVIQNDQIIAKWVFMYIGGVPLPIPLPFGVFPNEKGRRSGLMVPTFGSVANRGQYFRNFGYYLALSDYMDLALTGDYYTRGGYGARANYRYAKRYDYSGSINLGYSNQKIGEDSDPDKSESKDYKIDVNHNQKFTPTTSLDVRLSFQTGTYLNNNSLSYNELLRQNVTSNASFSKRWDDWGASLNVGYSRNQNLQSGDINETLPSLRFSKQTFYPFRSDKSSRGDQRWYELIGMNYNGQFQNTRKKVAGDLSIRGGIQHTASISASPKVGFFNITTSANYNEKWYNKSTRIRSEYLESINTTTGDVTYRDSLVYDDIHEINMVRTFSLNLSASTKIYGMMQPKILGIEAFRHTIIPQITYSLSPDFSDDQWGYYDSYVNAAGKEIRYDKYQREIFGGVGSGESQNMNFSVGNIFEMKTMKNPTDTTSQEKKITLLNLNLSSGYNLAADSLRLNDLRVTFRTQIGDLLNFSGSTAYTFYDYVGGRKVNRFLSDEGRGIFRLTNLSFSLSTTLSGDKLKGSSEKKSKEEEETEAEYDAFRESEYISIYDEKPPDFEIPWNLSLSYNYNMNKTNPEFINETSSIGLNLSFSLTKNWKFTARSNYDFIRKEFLAPAITVFRDLHCWEMNFSWYPLGTYRGFRFELRMKAPEFRDIKVERSSGRFSGR